MKYAFCTSFSPAGYEHYGRKFLKGFLKYCDFPIHVFHEHSQPTEKGPIYHDLLEDRELLRFLETCPPDGNDYRHQANRFSRKVFAVTQKAYADCWIWIDADIEVFGKIDKTLLDDLCPPGKGSYIGREGWHHSECGFVAYRDHSFLKTFREAYISGDIFKMDEWHDSYVFDQLRGEGWHNIAEGIPGMHPWPQTPLGKVMRHNKGPAAKLRNYKTWKLPEEDAHFRKYLSTKDYQKDLVTEALKYCRRLDIALDVGAHVGFLTARLLDNFTHVVAIEPERENFDCLAHNCPGAQALNYALGDRRGFVGLSKPAHNNSGSWRVTNGNDAQMIHMDDLNLKQLDLVKIDTQGSEAAILRGGMKTLKKFKPVLIIEAANPHGKEIDPEVKALIDQIGLEVKTTIRRDVICAMNN